MRATPRSRRTEEEGESAFISMTDMAVSFLFIVMILLAFFATQINQEETVPKELLDQRDKQVADLQALLLDLQSGDPSALNLVQKIAALQKKADILEAELAQAKLALQLSPGEDLVQKVLDLRAEIDRLHRLLERTSQDNPIEHYNRLASTELGELLLRIRDRINKVDDKIDVKISDTNDALHFAGDGLFPSGSSEPTQDGRERLRKIARILDEEIGCFTFGGPVQVSEICNPRAAVIEAVQVEGHTDTVGDERSNMRLSARRAAAAFDEIVGDRPGLLDFDNLRGQPVLSVAGYGKGRTIADEAQPGGKDANRRIDIRFIMYAPADEDSIPRDVDDLGRVSVLLGGKPE